MFFSALCSQSSQHTVVHFHCFPLVQNAGCLCLLGRKEMDLVISDSSIWGFSVTACHCRIWSSSLKNSHRVSKAFLYSTSVLYLQPRVREVKNSQLKCCQVSEDILVPLLISVSFAILWLFLLRTQMHIGDCSVEKRSAGECCSTTEF